MVYNDLMMCLSSITIDNWPGLAPIPRLPRPSQSVHFSDLSETLGPRDQVLEMRSASCDFPSKKTLKMKITYLFILFIYNNLWLTIIRKKMQWLRDERQQSPRPHVKEMTRKITTI